MPAGGIHNQIKYATLRAPAILAAHTEYYLVSQETAGEDFSYGDKTMITTTAAAAVLASASSDDGSMWWRYGTFGSYGYGPLDLKYCEFPITGQLQIGNASSSPSLLLLHIRTAPRLDAAGLRHSGLNSMAGRTQRIRTRYAANTAGNQPSGHFHTPPSHRLSITRRSFWFT